MATGAAVMHLQYRRLLPARWLRILHEIFARKLSAWPHHFLLFPTRRHHPLDGPGAIGWSRPARAVRLEWRLPRRDCTLPNLATATTIPANATFLATATFIPTWRSSVAASRLSSQFSLTLATAFDPATLAAPAILPAWAGANRSRCCAHRPRWALPKLPAQHAQELGWAQRLDILGNRAVQQPVR